MIKIPYVNVPNDLSKIKTKVAFNLTKRQLICFGCGAAVGIPAYVTIPVNTSNTSTQGLADHYKDFYTATVDRYHGVLMDASNYEYDLIGGKTLAQEFGQTSVTVNRNYLEFNPIYGLDGSPISSAQLSNAAFNVLLPESREQEEEYWREYVRDAYSMETNFIFYDGEASKIYSYNADTREE